MKKKAFFLTILISLMSIISYSQEYYYYNHTKIPIKISKQALYISTSDTTNVQNLTINLKSKEYSVFNELKLEVKNLNTSNHIRYEKFIDFINPLPDDIYSKQIEKLRNKTTIVSPFFEIQGNLVGTSAYFYVCLHQVYDSSILKDFAESQNVRIVAQDKYMPNWFTLAITENSIMNNVETANIFYESGLFLFAEPDWRTNRNILSNDELYSLQWGLKNTGQNCKPTGIGRDINVEPAWSFSTGKDIVIAIIDQGVQLDHPDLINNIYSTNYDVASDALFNITYGDHGTCCAGVVGAIQDNNIGISGVAPNCKIMSISLSMYYSMPISYYATAINWAWKHGADILSNSYHIPTPSNYVNNAIDSALQHGRNGLGCPILFASGNNNSSSINYPASLANTIAVGAMSPCGERKNPNSCDGESWGSNYGSGLDVVAPGVLIPTTTVNNGYNLSFNGTSSACPHAAGVMALILSANPCLTATEAREILCSTCDKLSGYSYNYNEEYGSWNTEVGYGKINAFKAITKTMNISPRSYTLSGISGSPYNLSRWVLLQQSCNVSSGTYLRVKRYEVVRDITFPYMENPIVYAVANGYSAANPNDGQPFCGVLNLTHTSAQLKTWVYYISYSINGQQINTYIPTTPQNIRFNTTIYEIPETNIYINNKSVVNTEYNRNALQNIETTNFSTQGSSIVKLRAGKEIIFGNGTDISPNSSGNFYAFIESFDICENNKATPIVSNPLEKEKKNYTNPEIANSVIQPIEETSFATENPTLSIYPNPTNGTFHIKLENTEEIITQVYINNMLGTEIFRKNNLQNDESINIATLPAGLYVVNVITNNGKIYFGKLVKQ